MKTLKQVKSLTDFDKRVLDEVKRIVMKHLPDASLYLFGSVARGDRGPESDYDVLVLTVGDLSMTQRENVEHDLYDLELARGIAISSVYVAKRRWRSPIISAIPFQRNVKREAIRL